MFGQNIQKCLGVFVAPSRVKADRNLWFFGFHTVNRKFPAPDSAAYGDNVRKEGRSAQKSRPAKESITAVLSSFLDKRKSTFRRLVIYSL